MELGIYQSRVPFSGNMTATGVKYLFTPDRPVEIIRIVFYITFAYTTPTWTVILKRRATAGSSAIETAALATVTMTSAANALGNVVFVDVVPVVVVNPGQQAVLESVGTTSVGGGSYGFLDYLPRAMEKRDTSTSYYAMLFDSNPGIG